MSQHAIDALLPKNVDKALQNSHCFKAMKNEYDFLVEKNVWSLVINDENQLRGPLHFALEIGPYFGKCLCRACFAAKSCRQVLRKDFYEN